MRRMTSIDLALADILRRRRVALGLSPRSVKALAGIEPCDLARYETASSPIPKRRLSRICQALSITPNELFASAVTNEAPCMPLADLRTPMARQDDDLSASDTKL